MNFEHRDMDTWVKANNISTMADLIADEFNEKYSREIEVYDVDFGYVVFLHELKIGNLDVIKLYYTLSEDVMFNTSLEDNCKMLFKMYTLNFNALFDAGAFDSIK